MEEPEEDGVVSRGESFRRESLETQRPNCNVSSFDELTAAATGEQVRTISTRSLDEGSANVNTKMVMTITKK